MKKPENGDPLCQTRLVHPEVVDRVRETMPEDPVLQGLADFFRIFGDVTRIRILHALSIAEMCVCDLSMIVGISQSAVSHQLKILRQANLVRYRREGKSAIYSLSDDHVKEIIEQGLTHISE